MSGALPEVHCPTCQTPIDPGDRFCSGCGAGLAEIALLLDQAASAIRSAPVSHEPAVPAPRLGEFLVQRGHITQPQLEQALARQKELLARGESALLGEILVEQGLLTRSGLDRAIVDHVIALQTALRDGNRRLAERVAERTTQLEQAIARAQEANQLKVNFVSNISHELRTPLTQIKGYVMLLHEQALGELTPRQADAMAVVAAASDRLETLIEDIIRFIIAARGELRIDAKHFSPTELAHAAVRRSDAKARHSHVALRYESPDQPIFARGDSQKLSWVLLQLIDNAIKSVPQGGSVTLRLEPDDSRRCVTVSVLDTGVGIPAERVAFLFESLTPGAGLGLALVRRIVEAHGSKMRVESVEGRGSTFSFDLPISSQP